MDIIYYPSKEDVEHALSINDPFLLMIAFDGSDIIISPIDDSGEHHILLASVNKPLEDLDKYFRVVADDRSAEWTFVCPKNYKGIPDRTKRIATFFKDGYRAISDVLSDLGVLVPIEIPTRYRRHMDAIKPQF